MGKWCLVSVTALFTHELTTAITTTCSRPRQSQISPNLSTDRGRAHEVPPLAEELSTDVYCQSKGCVLREAAHVPEDAPKHKHILDSQSGLGGFKIKDMKLGWRIEGQGVIGGEGSDENMLCACMKCSNNKKLSKI